MKKRTPEALAALGYLTAATLFAWPLPLHLGDRVTGLVSGDTGVYIWNLWVFRHEIITHHFPFFTRQIPLEEGVGAFDCLGLDIKTLRHHPKSAMKIVMHL